MGLASPWGREEEAGPGVPKEPSPLPRPPAAASICKAWHLLFRSPTAELLPLRHPKKAEAPVPVCGWESWGRGRLPGDTCPEAAV